MKGTESGKDKVKKICDILRRDTLEPAQQEAEAVVQSAHDSAAKIVAEAHREAERIREEARQDIQRQKNVFHSSLNQACKQALESLKQMIEGRLLNKELGALIGKKTQDPKVLANLIEAVVKAIQEKGIEADLSAYVPAKVPARDVNHLLAEEVLHQLKEKSVLIGTMGGGIEVKLHGENITLDLSDATLKELVANYIRKDFRELIFGA